MPISCAEKTEQEVFEVQIIAAKVKSSGEVVKQIPVTQISGSRKSGFPQMELAGDKLLFA